MYALINSILLLFGLNPFTFRFSGLPTCAQGCESNKDWGCKSPKIGCICSSDFIGNFSYCLAESCSDLSQEVILEHLGNLCSAKVGSFSVPRLAIGKRLPQAAVSSFIPPSFPVQPSVFPQPSFSVQPSFLPVPSFASSTSSVHISSPVATILSTSQSYATLSSTFRITSRPVSSSARSPTAGGTLSSSPGQSTLSPAQTPPPSSTQQNAHHLSQGAKIGIGVGAALAAILLAALLIIFVIRRRRARSQDMTYDIYAGATPAPGAMSQIPGSGPYEVSGETTLSQPPQPGIYEIGGSDARPPRAFLRPSRYP